MPRYWHGTQTEKKMFFVGQHNEGSIEDPLKPLRTIYCRDVRAVSGGA